jgi:hypothetical protein
MALTFELSGRSRQGAWAAERMMTLAAPRPKCPAGGGLLKRGVSRHHYYAFNSASKSLTRDENSRSISQNKRRHM